MNNNFTESGDSGEYGEYGDSGESDESGDSGESGKSGKSNKSGESGETVILQAVLLNDALTLFTPLHTSYIYTPCTAPNVQSTHL